MEVTIKNLSVCGVFEMTNVLIVSKFFPFLPSNIMKASGALRVLECSQRNSLSSGLDNCLEFLKGFTPGSANTKKKVLLKVQVFLQLSDAGEISELIMEMAFL